MVGAVDSSVLLCTREELYSLVWETPPAQLSKRFAISDVGLAKLCRRHTIPVPYRGYWARVAAGQTPQRPRLPKGPDLKISLVLRTEGEAVAMAESDLEVAAVIAAARDAESIVVPTDLAAAHEITRKIRGKLWRLKTDDYGRLAAEGDKKLMTWVSRSQMDRSLCIVDAIIRGSERRNYQVIYDGYYTLTVGIGSQKIRFLIEEGATRVETPPEEVRRAPTWRPRYTYTPSGKLTLKVDHWTASGRGVRRTWTDTSRSKVEDRLAEFFLSIAALSVYLRRDAEESEGQRQRWEEQERRRREHEKAAGQLYEIAQGLQQLEVLRAAVAAIEKRGLDMSKPVAGFPNWKDWAANYLDHLDPLDGLKLADPGWYPSLRPGNRF